MMNDNTINEKQAQSPAGESTVKREFNRFGGQKRETNAAPTQQGDRPDRRGRNPRRDREAKEDDGLIKKTVSVNRVVKVVKGGRIMRFSAVVVVGDGNGRVGIGSGKASEVPQAIEKATIRAKASMVEISRKDTTIPHEIMGKFGRGHVLLLPAEKGTGVIAGGSVRSVLDAAGIKDIRTKSYGTNTPVNCVKATFTGLTQLRTVEQVATMRGKTVEEILGGLK